MIIVACVLRSGGIYDAEWVRKLRDAVARNLTLPHRFVALSDVPVPCERIPLQYDWEVLTADRPKKHDWAVAPKWWSKCELWRPGALPTDETVLYLDLDSLITGSLNALASASYPRLTMAADPWARPSKCSAVMAWRGDYSIIFDKFAADPDGIAHHYDVDEPHRGRIGDQAFIEDTVQADTFPPGMIASYKVDNCQAAPPRAAVCMFHGKPKMHEIKTGWVPELWK